MAKVQPTFSFIEILAKFYHCIVLNNVKHPGGPWQRKPILKVGAGLLSQIEVIFY